jgi:hypothetical protein
MGESTAKTMDGHRPVPPRSIDSRSNDGAPANDEQAAPTAGPAADTGGSASRWPGGFQEFLAAQWRWMRTPRNPQVWFELVLILVSYRIYSMIRNHAPTRARLAEHHAQQVWDAEKWLHINAEHAVNHAINSVTPLITVLNYDYDSLHYIVTTATLVWLYRSHPGRYAAGRLVIFATTGLALIGYYCYPLAPPRLLPGAGFIDTVRTHGTYGSMSSGDLSHVSNQFAAMPSMHIGWSVWCGLTIAILARRRWVKALGVLYPISTLTVIVATANHFFMDAIGGLVTLGIGFAISWAVFRSFPYRLPRYVDPAVAASRPRWREPRTTPLPE